MKLTGQETCDWTLDIIKYDVKIEAGIEVKEAKETLLKREKRGNINYILISDKILWTLQITTAYKPIGKADSLAVKYTV